MKRSSDEEPRQAAKTPRTLSKMKSTSSSLDRICDSVHVFCRLKPLQDITEASSVKLISSGTLTLSGETKLQRKECNYVFKHIFSSYSNQREVFEYVALPLLEDVINGKNGLLFTYGVTGSGKTFTLTGDQTNPGIMPRCIDTLFNTIGEHQAQKYLIKSDRMNGFEVQSESDALEERFLEARTPSKNKPRTARKVDSGTFYVNDGTRIANFLQGNRYSVFISYIEIYNNAVYDLLDESTGKVMQTKILREDVQKNMYVNNVVEVEVKSAAEAFELFNLGQKRKRMAHTVLNSGSSRSHSTFTIRVVQLQQESNVIPERNLLKIGQLSLVDLAGSERCSRTQTTGIRLKEASSINNSLMSLRTCLDILRENQTTGSNKLVPYRDSRLTLLFKNYFEGEGQVRMIVCINPSVQDYEENLQVLKFAEMTQEVKVQRSEARYATPYKKTPKLARDIKKIQTPYSSIKAKKLFAISLTPKFPENAIIFNLEDPQANEIITDTYIKILQARKKKGEINSREFTKKEDHFRKRLLQVTQDYVLSRSEMQNLKALLKKNQNSNNNLEAKLIDLETVNDSLAAKNTELQEVIKQLHGTIEEKNLRLNQNHLEREKVKQKFALQSAKMSQELDEKLRRQRQHLQAVMEDKDSKLKRVKEILNNNEVQKPRSSPPEHQKLNAYTPQQTPEVVPRRNLATSSNKHRRSRSAGDVYLEHNTVKPVALGTVFQPTMKKRKSVTKLDKAKDVTNAKQNKYCLLAQQPDAGGELETKLYKADILPTCGGGAQVIFNDVERLTQQSPTGTPNNHK